METYESRRDRRLLSPRVTIDARRTMRSTYAKKTYKTKTPRFSAGRFKGYSPSRNNLNPTNYSLTRYWNGK